MSRRSKAILFWLLCVAYSTAFCVTMYFLARRLLAT